MCIRDSPQALQAAIPSDYAGPLFEKSDNNEASQSAQEGAKNASSQQLPASSASEQWGSDEQRNALIEHGRKVTVVGVAIYPDKKQTFIIAGTTSKKSTGETIPVAICVEDDTTLLKQTGEFASAGDVEHLQENAEIVVEGKKSKRGVIHATHIMI